MEFEPSAPQRLWMHKKDQMVALRDIPEEEIREYRQALTHLRELEEAMALMSIFEANAAAFQKVVNNLRDGIETEVAKRKQGFLALDVNRHFMNVLFSFRLYLDHGESRLKRRYGKDSVPVIAFKSACSATFDSSFAYRFCYKLRGYAQHAGLPIGEISNERWLTSDGSIASRLVLQFDIEELLQRGKGHWGKLVQADLCDHAPSLDVMPIAEQLVDDVAALHATIVDDEKSQFEASACLITWTVGEVLAAGGMPFLADRRSTGAPTKFNALPVPLEAIKSLELGPMEFKEYGFPQNQTPKLESEA